MVRYHRLRLAEREEFSRMLAQGYSFRHIARQLGRAPSTLSREVPRHWVSRTSYRAVIAHHQAQTRARRPRRRRKLDVQPHLRAVVFQRLAQRWSPEQIAIGLRQDYPTDRTMRLSHETIYTYLYVLGRGQLKRELIRYLRQRHHVRRPRQKRRRSTRPIQDLISIEERPAEVADRIVPGHWEGDLLMGRRNASALGILVERTTRFTILVPLRAKDATTVRQAFARELRTLPQQLKRSLTYDQGQEMREHRLFTQGTLMRVYFAHHIVPGSGARVRTPTDSCASSFPREPTSPP